MGQHRNEVSRGVLFAVFPDLSKADQAFDQFGPTLLFSVDHTTTRHCCRHIRPSRELGSVFVGKIKQCGEHTGRQFNGNGIHPVKGLAFWKRVQHFTGTLSDQGFHARQVASRDYWRNSLSLHIVLWLIHRDEHTDVQRAFGQRLINGETQRDTVRTGKILVIRIDGFDLFITRQ